MRFDVTKPATLGQLAAVYAGNPNLTPAQVDSDLRLNADQGYGYIQQQARSLGIGDPERYFSAQRMRETMASTPSGGLMEANRIAGQFAPGSLPAQMAAREGRGDALMQSEVMRAKEIAALQSSRLDKQYALPQPGMAPQLSPLMQQDAAAKGMNPMAYLMNQRLGGNRAAVAPFNQMSSAANPEALYNEPSFRAAMERDPSKANQIFGALTGDSLMGSKDAPGFQERFQAAKVKENAFADDTLRKALAANEAVFTKDGLRWRKQEKNAMTGKLEFTDTLEEGNAFQRSVGARLPYVNSGIARFEALAAKGGAGGAAGTTAAVNPVAPLQNPAAIQAAQTGGFYTPPEASTAAAPWAQAGVAPKLRETPFAEGFRPVYNFGQSVKQTFGGTPQFAAESQLNLDANSLAILSTPQFKAFQQREPAKARAWLLQLQEGRDVSHSAPVDFSGGTMY